MNLKKEFGRRIKELRVANNLTQEKLAEITEYGIVNISRVENGHVFPSPEVITVFANTFDVQIYELFIFDEPPKAKMSSTKHQLLSLAKNASPKQAKLISEISLKVIKLTDI